jgi:hypothetical protein
MEIAGRCHCGTISFLLVIEPTPKTIPARACGCSFCQKHGGVWTSSPNGVLRIAVAGLDQVSRYQFGTRTATFHICRRCGVVPVVTSEIDGQTYAVVSVNALENVPETLLDRAPVSFDGESEGERLARREKNWIPDVRYAATSHLGDE